ncbi:unnamed protein product [Adineta ricciae]|uniref:G-protein coupled receptors family 1 profile domain-containing protein n=1 Tax=Adineta ricciae TaxID=249248 RepID=A0A815L3E5_ADIRI|nr:unnamed protein product [Adineta ricciae]CAF1480591.1 unnamed protein product [Adineta ricciae]
MNLSTSEATTFKTDYSVTAPLSMAFGVTSIIITSYILIIILSTKQLYTVTRLLTCNTCLASMLYCVVQFINYIHLLVIKWDTSDESCRWRGYFGYMSMVSFVYSYLLQVISRFFFIVLWNRYRWLTSYKAHFYVILFGWIVILTVPLPAILTTDIHFRPGELCWVASKYELHTYYIIVAYYVIPILSIVIFNVLIFIRIYQSRKTSVARSRTGKRDRDYEIFRNVMISFSVYFLGGLPIIIHMLVDVELLYSIGVVSVTFAVSMEKLVIIYLDRDIRILFRNFFCQKKTQVVPMTVFTVR